MIHKVLSDIDCSNLCKAHLQKIPVDRILMEGLCGSIYNAPILFKRLIRISVETPIFSRSDSIVLRRTTLQSTPVSLFPHVHSLLGYSVPHHQPQITTNYPDTVRGSVRLLTWPIIRDTNGETTKTKLLHSYIKCLNNKANNISLNFQIQLA